MLFNSYTFLLAFLPIVLMGYFLLSVYVRHTAALLWLAGASLFFYSFWNVLYLPLILCSILVNYFCGCLLQREPLAAKVRTGTLWIGVLFNVFLLGYFKYADFFVQNIHALLGYDAALPGVVLPLAISFYTFTQIAYLVDSYKKLTQTRSLLEYGLFVLFFPHLIAGPIVHYRNLMTQFADPNNKRIIYRNLNVGLYLLILGLFKKVMIADMFSQWTIGFDNNLTLTFFEAWFSALAYAFQIYFDFSGYADMAIGIALLFNIRFPKNFDSPYKALTIQDFWRRWHITLSNFLRDYIYIPLGGDRKGMVHGLINGMIIFLIGGLWHGASWTFVVWGALHGLGYVIFRLWSRFTKISLPKIISWSITFGFVCVTWVFFRAKTLAQAFSIVSGMFGFNGVSLPSSLAHFFGQQPFVEGGWMIFSGTLYNIIPLIENDIFFIYGFMIFALIVVIGTRNSTEIAESFTPTKWYFAKMLCLIITVLFSLNRVSEFIYFNF